MYIYFLNASLLNESPNAKQHYHGINKNTKQYQKVVFRTINTVEPPLDRCMNKFPAKIRGKIITDPDYRILPIVLLFLVFTVYCYCKTWAVQSVMFNIFSNL